MGQSQTNPKTYRCDLTDIDNLTEITPEYLVGLKANMAIEEQKQQETNNRLNELRNEIMELEQSKDIPIKKLD